MASLMKQIREKCEGCEEVLTAVGRFDVALLTGKNIIPSAWSVVNAVRHKGFVLPGVKTKINAREFARIVSGELSPTNQII